MPLPKDEKLIAFLKSLFDTNAEFASSHDNEFFAKFKDEQSPKLTILKCSDSRVQMESFDKTPQNGVFAVRNIGNQISTCEGSIAFGVEVLKTPFLLIIGHSDCGAVNAVLNNVPIDSSSIRAELSTLNIKEKCIHKAIIENVNNQVSQAVSKYQDKVKKRELTIIGAIYDFKNDFGSGHGRVILTNVNNITDIKIINEIYAPHIENLHCLKE